MSYYQQPQFGYNPVGVASSTTGMAGSTVPTGNNMGKKIAIGLLVLLVLVIIGAGIGLAIWYFWPTGDETPEGTGDGTGEGTGDGTGDGTGEGTGDGTGDGTGEGTDSNQLETLNTSIADLLSTISTQFSDLQVKETLRDSHTEGSADYNKANSDVFLVSTLLTTNLAVLDGLRQARAGLLVDCDKTPANRSCEAYNVAELNGTKYICPDNYTLLDGYSPGGMKGPVCHMNNGAQNTPNTCKVYKHPGCDYKKYKIPCVGLWPDDKYKGQSFYNKWRVVNAMPASEVCGK